MTINKPDLSKYVVNVQGKDFITFPGLLAEAHGQGLVGIETSLVNPENPKSPIVKAIVTLRSAEAGPQGFKVFTGYGDATETNVAKKVSGALLRMAETRAIARALRFACNIDMTAIEELDADDDVKPNSSPTKTFSRSKPAETTTIQVTSTSGNGVHATKTEVVNVPNTVNDTSQVAEKRVQPAPTLVAKKPAFTPRSTKTEPSFP